MNIPKEYTDEETAAYVTGYLAGVSRAAELETEMLAQVLCRCPGRTWEDLDEKGQDHFLDQADKLLMDIARMSEMA